MRIIFFIVLILTSQALLAQVPKMKLLTSEDGLPSSHVYSTIQDAKGYIWICTDKGIVRFDGYHFEIFTVKNGLPSNDVWNLTEDDQRRLWLSTYDKLTYYKSGQFHTVSLSGEIQLSGLINHYYIKEDSSLFFTAEPGPALFQMNVDGDVEDVKLIPFSQKIEHLSGELSHFFYIGKDHEHNNWYRVFSIESVNKMALLKEKSGTYEVHEIIEDASFDRANQAINFQDKVLFHSGEYVYSFDFDIVKKKSSSDLFGGNYSISFISKINKDEILVVTNRGNIVVNKELELVNGFDFITEMTINSLFEDASQNLWISTPLGLHFLPSRGRNSKSFLFSAKKSDNEVTALALNRAKQLLVGTATGGLYIFDGNKNFEDVTSGHSTPIFRQALRELYPQKNGDLLIGGNAGIIVAEERELVKKRIARTMIASYGPVSNFNLQNYNDCVEISLKAVATTLDSQSYIIAHSHGINILNKHSYQRLPPYAKGTKWNRVYAVALDDDDVLWVGRKSGLYCLSDYKNVTGNEQKSNFSMPVNDIKIRNGNEKWIATDGFGLYRKRDDEFELISETKNDIINSLYIDHHNNLWMATNKGAKKLFIEKENPLIYRIQSFSVAQGLASNEVNKILMDGEKLFLGTKEGLTIVEEEKDTENSEQPVLLIRGLSINDKDTSIEHTYQLHYHQNNIKIEYVCLSYKSQGHINYYYQMTGVDTMWRTTFGLEQSYPLLPPGEYEFKIQAEDIDGNKSEVQTIQFIIKPPWWEHAWVRILLGGILGAIVIAVMQWRIKRIHQKNKMKQQFAELELQALQAQMNPHFISNALQAIQDFIFDKDEFSANRYLVKFSRLMRLFLESSKEKYILLRDEIQMLRLYIELEKMRFEDRFDYHLTIDSRISVDLIEIPSMLLQPFVENAINHGLVYKKDKGLLSIEIKQEQEVLVCWVKDNGIGRKKAQEIKQRSYKSYKSRGMELVRERQKVLNFMEDSNLSIQVKDLYDDDGCGRGTCVEVRINLF